MAADDYSIVSHADGGVTDDALSALALTCFGGYGLVAPPTPAFMEWYRMRPGMDAQYCLAAIAQAGEIASSLFVTDADLQVSGTGARAAVIDTVMTAPQHRKRGLASRLITTAADRARERGRDLMVLFTGADSGPERLYSGLGFRRVARIAVAIGSPGAAPAREGVTWRRLAEGDRVLLGGYHSTASGFRPYTPGHCSWLLRSPASYSIGVIGDPTALVGQAALVAGTVVRIEGEEREAGLVVDLLGTLDTDSVARLMGSLPVPNVVVCYDAMDTAMAAACSLAGLSVQGYDVAMALPLADRWGPSADFGTWYPLTESIIGF